MIKKLMVVLFILMLVMSTGCTFQNKNKESISIGTSIGTTESKNIEDINTDDIESQSEDEIYPIKENGLYGFINNKGEVVIKPIATQIYSWTDGMACTDKGVFDCTGKMIVKDVESYSVYGFFDGIGTFKKNKKYGFIDKSGKAIIPPIYSDIKVYFTEGRAIVKAEGQKEEEYIVINKQGEALSAVNLPNNYYVSDFNDGCAVVVKKGVFEEGGTPYAYIDKDGKYLLGFEKGLKINNAEKIGGRINFSNGLAVFEKAGQGFGYIDKEGKTVINPIYKYACRFSEGLGVVKENKFGAVDQKGKVVIPLKYDMLNSFSDGLAGARVNGKYGFVDKKGKMAISPQYDKVLYFRGGICLVAKDGKELYINKKGNIIWKHSESIIGDYLSLMYDPYTNDRDEGVN